MPHMDGCAVLAALHDAMPADAFLPVVVLTADSSATARNDALDAGAKDFLTKPIDRVETVLRVRNLLETGALYRSVQGHNATLRAELDERREQETRRSSERLTRRARIERVLQDRALSMVFSRSSTSRTGGSWGVKALARYDAEPRRPPNEWVAEATDERIMPVEDTVCRQGAPRAGLADACRRRDAAPVAVGPTVAPQDRR